MAGEQAEIQSVLAQLAKAQLEQQNLQNAPVPQAGGFLAPGQTAREAITNPDQAQLDLIVNGVLGALNPNSRAPLVSGAVSGLSALQSRRADELSSKRIAHKQATSALKDRIDNLSKQGNLLSQSANISTSNRNATTAELGLDVKRGQLGVSKRNATVNEAGQALDEQERTDRLSTVEMLQFIDPASGQLFDFSRDAFGELSVGGQKVSPGALGLVPFDNSLLKSNQEQARDIRTAGSTIADLSRLVFDPKFPAAVGRFDIRRIAAQQGGIGGDVEVLNKQAQRLSGDQILKDLKKLGVNPTNKDLAFSKTLNVTVNSDPEVWHDKLLNSVIPYYFNRLKETQGEAAALEQIKPIVQSLPADKFLHPADKGGIVDRLLNPGIQDSGAAVFNPDGSGGITSGGRRFKRIQRDQPAFPEVPVLDEP